MLLEICLVSFKAEKKDLIILIFYLGAQSSVEYTGTCIYRFPEFTVSFIGL